VGGSEQIVIDREDRPSLGPNVLRILAGVSVSCSVLNIQCVMVDSWLLGAARE